MNEVIIHKTRKHDIDSIVSVENDDENSQFIFPNSKEEHFKLMTDENFEHLLLKSKNNKILGFVILAGLKNINRSIEFRRIVIKQKGKGIGRIVIKKLIKYSFENLNCNRFWLDVLERNQRARYLYQSEGFKEEGKLRECIMIENKFESLIIMSILKNEYLKTTANNMYN